MNSNNRLVKALFSLCTAIGAIVFLIAGIYGMVYFAKNFNMKNEISGFSAFLASIIIKKEVIEPRMIDPQTFPITSSTPLTVETPRQKQNILVPGDQTTRNYPLNSTVSGNLPDLTVAIVDTGIVDQANNFSHSASTGPGQHTGIVFDVSNAGGAVSSFWSFQAILPVASGNYTSDKQEPIPTGGKIRYTIGFRDLLAQGTNTAIIVIDPNSQIQDANRANNTATTTLIRAY